MNSGEVVFAVVIEPTGSRPRPRSVMVGRTVAYLKSDRWVPVKVLNPFDKPVSLKWNIKLADMSFSTHNCQLLAQLGAMMSRA